MSLIIDFHTHTFPDGIAERAIDSLSHASRTVPFSDGTVDGLLHRMDEAGISRSVILPVATSPRQVSKINDSSAKINEEHEGRLISFGAMHPDCEDYREELARFSSLGLIGVKLHPVYQGCALNDIKNLRIIDRAAELGLIVITHTGYDVGYPDDDLCSPRMARDVWDKVCGSVHSSDRTDNDESSAQQGGFKLILAHMGGWMQWEEVPGLLADTDCYIDTSFSTGRMTHREGFEPILFPEQMLDVDGFMKLLNAFGSKRILFGTDSPWSDAASEIAFIRSLPISESEKEDILGGNAVRLIGK